MLKKVLAGAAVVVLMLVVGIGAWVYSSVKYIEEHSHVVDEIDWNTVEALKETDLVASRNRPALDVIAKTFERGYNLSIDNKTGYPFYSVAKKTKLDNLTPEELAQIGTIIPLESNMDNLSENDMKEIMDACPHFCFITGLDDTSVFLVALNEEE